MESGFNPNVTSGAGAVGIAQIVPKYHPGVNARDPVASLNWAANYMAGLVKQYGGSYAKALSVYNSGRPDAYLDPGFANGQTYRYVRGILAGQNPAGQSPAPPARVPSPGLTASSNSPVMPVSPLANPAVQAAITRNDALIGIAPPNFAAIAPAQQAQPKQAVTVHGVNPKSPHDANAVKTIEQYLGTPYVWGGSKPGGFDCSGLLKFVWQKQGVNIPRTTYDQWKAGSAVGKSQLQPGDAVFFTGSDSMNGLPGHVGMFIGGGRFIEAPYTGANVRISTLASRTDYVGARRFA